MEGGEKMKILVDVYAKFEVEAENGNAAIAETMKRMSRMKNLKEVDLHLTDDE